MLKNIKKINFMLISFLLVVLTFLGIVASVPSLKSAKADESTLTQETAVESIALVGYYANTNDPSVGFVYYVPTDCYNSTNFTYGVVLFPTDYFGKYGIPKGSDYIVEFDNKQVQIYNIGFTADGKGEIAVHGGYLFYATVKVSDQNLDRTFFICPYVKDNTTGNYVYVEDISFTYIYNNIENNNFDNDIDLTQYITLEFYQSQVSKLNKENTELKSQITDLENKVKGLEEDSKDSRSSIWLIVGGVLILVVLLVVVSNATDNVGKKTKK